jgi:hypothetical protein
VYAIKTAISDPAATAWVFASQKTMYAGKRVAVGDAIFVFAGENEGGNGLVAQGVVTASEPVPPRMGIDRQTPLVSITVTRTATARRQLGRNQLKTFNDWKDGRPETELNFKFYRQATNKIVGITNGLSTYLESFFNET